jgi:hypothetical protein
MKKPVIVCCESGMRSNTAKKYIEVCRACQEVYNGGSWESVLKIINKL